MPFPRQGDERDHGGIHLRRRTERTGPDHKAPLDPDIALDPDRQRAVVLGPRLGVQPLGHFLLHHEHRPRQVRRPGHDIPHERRTDIIRQVADDFPRAFQRLPGEGQRVGIEHLHGGGGAFQLGMMGSPIAVLFDEAELGGAPLVDDAGDGTRTGADFQHPVLRPDPQKIHDAGRGFGVFQKMLAKAFLGPRCSSQNIPHTVQGKRRFPIEAEILPVSPRLSMMPGFRPARPPPYLHKKTQAPGDGPAARKKTQQPRGGKDPLDIYRDYSL